MFVNSCQSFYMMFEFYNSQAWTILSSIQSCSLWIRDRPCMYGCLLSATPRNTFATLVWMVLDILLGMFLCFVCFTPLVIKLAIFVSITRFMQGNMDVFTPSRGSMIDLVLAEVRLLISSLLWSNKCYFAVIFWQLKTVYSASALSHSCKLMLRCVRCIALVGLSWDQAYCFV